MLKAAHSTAEDPSVLPLKWQLMRFAKAYGIRFPRAQSVRRCLSVQRRCARAVVEGPAPKSAEGLFTKKLPRGIETIFTPKDIPGAVA
jgi:hypothetical protein